MNPRWPVAALGDVLRYRKQFITIDDTRTYRRPRVRLHAEGIVLRDVVDGASIRTKSQQVCRCGDFLVAEIDAKVGGFGIVPSELAGAIVSSHYFLFETDEAKLDRRFLDWFIRTPAFREQVEAQGSTNYAAIRPADVLQYRVPLPPLAEQRRIVAQIDALASASNEALALRHQAIDESHALSGAMASELFDKCTEHKPIEAIADVRGGIQKTPDRRPGANPVRYLTVAHVQRNRVLLDDPRFFEVSPDELERCRLLAGDVLIIEGNGSAEQIGRTALFRGEIKDCVHQNHVIRIRPNPERLDSEFLNAFLNCPTGQDAVQAQSRTTSGLRTLSVGRIKQIAVPVPPMVDQRRIITQINELAAKSDALAAVQIESAAELNALMPAILDRAFRGEL